MTCDLIVTTFEGQSLLERRRKTSDPLPKLQLSPSKILTGKSNLLTMMASEMTSDRYARPRSDTYVRSRIDSETKILAGEALEAMGLSISDAIRLLMVRIAEEKRMPFEVRVPNATTKEAIRELEAGEGRRAKDVANLFDDLKRNSLLETL